ncbi:MAG: hypothetical protein WD269_06810 [Acidimicrobiia bacterium]
MPYLHAEDMTNLPTELRAHVDLIALNPTPLSRERASSGGRIDGFAGVLRSLGVNVTIRDHQGP